MKLIFLLFVSTVQAQDLGVASSASSLGNYTKNLFKAGLEIGALGTEVNDGETDDGVRVRFKTISFSRPGAVGVVEEWGRVDVTFDIENVSSDSRLDFRTLEASVVRFVMKALWEHKYASFEVSYTPMVGRVYHQVVRPGYNFTEVDYLSLPVSPKLHLGNVVTLSVHAAFNLGSFRMSKEDPAYGKQDFNNSGYHIRSGWGFSIKDAFQFSTQNEYYVYEYRFENIDDDPQGKIKIETGRFDFDLSTIIPPLSKKKLYLYGGWEWFNDQVDYTTSQTENVRRFYLGGRINFKGFDRK